MNRLSSTLHRKGYFLDYNFSYLGKTFVITGTAFRQISFDFKIYDIYPALIVSGTPVNKEFASEHGIIINPGMTFKIIAEEKHATNEGIFARVFISIVINK